MIDDKYQTLTYGELNSIEQAKNEFQRALDTFTRVIGNISATSEDQLGELGFGGAYQEVLEKARRAGQEFAVSSIRP